MFVIPSEAWNLQLRCLKMQIPRFARNDKGVKWNNKGLKWDDRSGCFKRSFWGLNAAGSSRAGAPAPHFA